MSYAVYLVFALLSLAQADPFSNNQSLMDQVDNPVKEGRFFYDDYEDCEWLVQYRGQTYDLSPVTKKTLAEPSEGDLRYVLMRVPKSRLHLERMEQDHKLSNIFTSSATASLVLLAVTRFVLPQLTETSSQFRDATSVTLAFTFGLSALKAWHHAKEAKKELARSITSFNELSNEKILPLEEKNNAASF